MPISCVMIVEDSEADQFINQNAVSKYDENIEILQAYDGQEALDVLDESDVIPDIIFLDINMPRMNGYEFLEIYDKKDHDKSPVVVMLTSSTQDKDKEQTSSYSCVKHYLEKPLQAIIMEEIEKLL